MKVDKTTEDSQGFALKYLGKANVFFSILDDSLKKDWPCTSQECRAVELPERVTTIEQCKAKYKHTERTELQLPSQTPF